MKTRQFLAALTLGIASFAAQAQIYQYTGQSFDFDYINTTPIVATFDFDFAHSPLAAYDMYEFKSWDVQSGPVHLSSANGDELSNRFTFDGSGNITGWFFNAGKISGNFADGNIQSLSKDFTFFAPNDAWESVLFGDPVQAAAVIGKSGTWTQLSAVPEPNSALMLLVGGMACAALRRRSKRA